MLVLGKDLSLSFDLCPSQNDLSGDDDGVNSV